MTPLDFALIALATGYWSFALAKTDGAFGMFAWTREHAPLGGLTTCPVCAAFWFALACYALMLTPLAPLVTVSAAAGGAVLLGHYVGLWQQ